MDILRGLRVTIYDEPSVLSAILSRWLLQTVMLQCVVSSVNRECETDGQGCLLQNMSIFGFVLCSIAPTKSPDSLVGKFLREEG